MNDIHAAEEKDREAKASARYREEQQTRRDDIGYEKRSKGRHLTNGKMRRHIGAQDDSLMAMMKSPVDLALAFFATDAHAKISIPDLWHAIQEHIPALRSNTNDPAQHVELLENEELSYVYHTAMVGEKVRARLQEVETKARALDIQRERTYASGQFGPIGDDFRLFKLKEAFDMRVHPLTGAFAFGEGRVRALQDELGCKGGSCPVTVFRAVATDSIRGIRINVADLNNDDTVKIAASDEANNKQAVTVALRPGLNFHLNG